MRGNKEVSHILIITGSARPNSVNKHMTDYVKQALLGRGEEVTVANLETLQLPYMDADRAPSAEGYKITHDSVQAFADMVVAADGVVFVVPEYNHSLSGIQKTAIDWLYHEWKDKPAAFVGYGWYGAKHSHDNFEIINSVIKLKLGEKFTGLTFKKEIDIDGSFLDETAAERAVSATLDELQGALS